MDQANILIIGGGVIGCAIAHAVSQRSDDVFLVEQNPKLGMATSTRNSGVIHSGIYYPRNSLKARLCLQGNRLMYEFCAKHNVPFRHTGKIVVAADPHEEPALSALKQNGEQNGVEGLRLIGPAEIRAREPHIAGVAALVLLVVTLFGQILTLGGVLLAAIKIAVVVIFLAVLTLVIFFILRDRFRHKRETELG